MPEAKRFILTNQTKNDKGFITLTSGIDLSRFKKNPVMLDMHDQKQLLGKWIDLKVDGVEISAAPKFNTKKPLAAEREQEVNDGFLNGTSFGLLPLQWAMSEDVGLPAGDLVLARSIAMEASLAPIPSNEDAIVMLYDANGSQIAQPDKYLNEVKLSFSNNKIESMDLKPIVLAAFGIPATASDAEITTAIQKAANDLKTGQTELQQLKAAETTRVENENKTTVESYRAQGLISDELVPTYIGLMAKDPEGTKKALSALKPSVATPLNLMSEMTKAASAAAAGGSAATTADKLNWKLADWMEKDKAGLEALKSSDNARYVKLFAEVGITVEA